MAIGGGLVVLGSFMPWATVTSGFGTASIAGTEGDGKITLVIGLALVLLAVLELTGSSNTRVVALIVAFVAVGVGLFDLVNVNERLADVTSPFVRASIGIGLYAVIGGGALAIVGGLMSRGGTVAAGRDFTSAPGAATPSPQATQSAWGSQYSVIIHDLGTSEPARVTKIIRRHLDDFPHDRLETMPCTVAKGVGFATAEPLRSDLTKAGASVDMVEM